MLPLRPVTSPLPVLILGFVLGMRHATDADHVMAVTTMVTRQRSLRAASSIGALWGLGHTATVLVVGGAIILFDLVVPPRLGLSLELSVSLMLVVLGGLNLLGALSRSKSPKSSSSRETHPHDEGGRSTSTRVRPLMIGVVHGLAGSAAIALLVLTTLHDARFALFYLALFGVGTIAGMMILTVLVALPFTLTARRFGPMHRFLTQASSALSIGLGLFLAYRVCVVDGLFSAAPRWIPQ